VADEISYGTNVVGQFLGERQRFAYETGQTLPQRVVEACNVMGFPGLFRDRLVPLRRDHAFVGLILIGVKPGLLAIRHRDLSPQLLSALPTTIPDVEGNNLAGFGVHGNPDPLPVGSLPYETPHLVGFGFSLVHDDLGWPSRLPHMEVIGTRRKAFHHKVQQPRETDAHGPTDPAQRDALAQQVFNQRALLIRNDMAFGAGHKLASTCFALMILFASASMAIFLVSVRLTLWARVYRDHSWLLTSAVLVTVLGQQ
jgi:hypothetical protein